LDWATARVAPTIYDTAFSYTSSKKLVIPPESSDKEFKVARDLM
jgi:hypothetical protein